MQRIKSVMVFIMVFFGLIMFYSCEKVTIKPSVSFSDGVVPIFESKCISCHAGSKNPNLKDHAYKSLKDGGYINFIEPEKSLLYIKLTTTHTNRINASETQIVLQWLNLGALDN
jgi:hypothetical protein